MLKRLTLLILALFALLGCDADGATSEGSEIYESTIVSRNIEFEENMKVHFFIRNDHLETLSKEDILLKGPDMNILNFQNWESGDDFVYMSIDNKSVKQASGVYTLEVAKPGDFYVSIYHEDLNNPGILN